MEKIKIGVLELRKIDLFAGMSYEEVLRLVFFEGNYVPLVRWTNSPAGKLAIPDYHKMSWAQRAEALNEIVPWKVERQQLINTTLRLDAQQRKKTTRKIK